MRNPLILTALAASLAIALGGCGKNGIGADSTVKQAVSTSTESKVEASREVKHNTVAKSTSSMPAMSLILKALPEYVAAQPRGAKDPHVTAAREIISVSQPVLGWPIACFGCSAQASWARGQAVRVAYANLVLTELSDRLPTQAMANSAAARKAIIATFLTIPAATLDADRREAEKQVHGGSFTPDFSGGDDVHFMLGTSGFRGGDSGWVWAEGGAPWYGDGLISGQKVELALDSAIDTGTTETSGTGSTTGTEAGRENTGQAGVK